MLGNGRPFVVEVLKPTTRSADLGEVQKRIVSKWADTIEVFGLRYSTRREMQHFKTKKFDKTYEVTLRFSEDVGREAAEGLGSALSKCEVRQRTPLRVLPRRKDATRRRLVKELKVLDYDPASRRACVRLRGESGLYVKELMTGDDGRTQPNVRTLLGIEQIEVESLDVVRVHDDFR
jgi:tRNA pseudouridine synthase 10